MDYVAACYGALCCFVLCVTFFACLLRRLPVYLVLLCRHAPRCARSRARARASACLVHHCTFSCVCSCLPPCLQWTICLLFEAFDFHKGFIFFFASYLFQAKATQGVSVKSVASPCRGETFASVFDGLSMSFKSPVKLRRALVFRAVELAMRVDRVHERVVDQSVDVTLPLKEEQSVDILVSLGIEDVVEAVRRLPSFERVQQRTAEQAECNNRPPCKWWTCLLPPLSESSVEVARFSPRERGQQRTFDKVEDVPFLGEDVEAIRFTTCEQVKHRTVGQVVHEPTRVQQHTAERGVPRPREETVEAVRSAPCERVQQQGEESVAVVGKFLQVPISERMCEQSEVIEVTETASQDRNLQCTVEQNFLDLVGAVKTVPQRSCVKSSAISKFPRSQARKVSKWSRVSLRSEVLNGCAKRARSSMSPRSPAKAQVCCA